jgi:hypothetical protein
LANVERYTLPSDFRSMQAVYMLFQAGQVRMKLTSFTREEYGPPNNGLTQARWPLKYIIQGGRIIFTPRPSADALNAVEFMYTPQWNGPLLDWSPIDMTLPNGWEEWVVLDVLQKMRTKLNLDTSDVMQAKMEMTARVIAAASKRSGDPPQMRDIYTVQTNPWYNSNPSGVGTWAGY